MSRTASSTICFQDRSSRLGTGRDMGDSTSPLAAGQVEGEDQVVDAVGRADLVAHVHQDPLRGVGVGERLDLDAADAVLELRERLLDVVPDQRLRRGVVRREDVVVDAAAPVGAHLPLAQGGADDDAHRFLDVLLVLGELDAPVGADREGELEADAEEIAHARSPQILPCYAVAIPTSTMRLQFGQLTVVRPDCSATTSPSENWHSGQTSPCVRPAVTASTTSYQSDSSSLRRSSGLSGMSAYPHCLSLVADSRRSRSRESASLVRPRPPIKWGLPCPPRQTACLVRFTRRGRRGKASARRFAFQTRTPRAPLSRRAPRETQ